MKKLFTLLCLLVAFSTIQAQTISYNTAGSTYSEDFNGLITTGTTNIAAVNGPFEIITANFAGSNVPGWYVERYAGTAAGVNFLANDGVSNSGAVFSYGTGTATDRALGMLASASKINRIGALIVNNSGSTLNSVTITFVTEQWRRGSAATANTMPFFYKVGATGINDAAGFTAATSLNMVTPNITAPNDVAKNGNDAAYRTPVSFTITGLTWTDGETLAIRWDDLNDTGNDDGLGIDDFTFSATASAAPTLGTSVSSLTVPNTIAGTASGAVTYTLTGGNLDGSAVTVTAPANFEVSLDGTNFNATQPVPYTAPTLSATISVRLTASAPAGVYTAQAITNTGGNATGVNVNVTGTVLPAEPTVQATDVTLTGITNTGFTVNWTNGNGASRIVVIRTTATSPIPPTDGITYAVPSTTGGGNTVYFNGTGTGPIPITGLIPGTSYTVTVYEANGTNYNVTTNATNPATASTTGVSPMLIQANFTSVATPLYSASGGNFRVPVMFFATVSNLTPNTTYKYYTQVAVPADFGTASIGAGNPILVDYTTVPVSYAYTASASLSAAGGYAKFTTNASGSFTGAFGFIHTGNAGKFTPGTVIYPAIAIAEESSNSAQYRFALDQSITVLGFATTAGVNDGSYIKGTSSATAGNIVALWKSIDGNSLATARPLSMTLAENPTITGEPWGTAATNFIAGYDQTSGSWNTIIPNNLPEGVRLIQQFNISSAFVVGCNSDADGVWPSGVITTNPAAGLTGLQITVADAPINTGTCFGVLPVSLTNFTAQKISGTVNLKWNTAQELNSRNFVIERSSDNRTWTAIATVAAAGNSTAPRNYTYTDVSPAKGMNYYRIKLVDMDYKAVTSIVRPVLFTEAYTITVGPNPATEFVNVYISKNDLKPTQVIVSDINGKIVQKHNTADQLVKINTTAFAKGVYMIKVISEEATSTHKIIIQ